MSPTHQDAVNRAYYDDFSQRYELGRHAGYHAMIDGLEVDALRPFLPGSRVLEVGCGTGLVMQRIQGLCAHVTGVDISPGMLAHAAAKGLDVVEGSALRLPFDDAQFDLVYAFKVLAHIEDIGTALSEMRRVLVPGGVLAAEFYNALSLRAAAKRLAGPKPVSQHRDESDVFTRWDLPRTVRGYLADMEWLGFHGVRVATPFAQAANVPVLGRALHALERRLAPSPLGRFGGFLIALARKPR